MPDSKLSALSLGSTPDLFYGEESGTSRRYYGDSVINVKNFGAKGDGVTDDAAAIQAAFDAAFGTVSSPHGNANRALNKRVYIPPGDYIIKATLNLRSVAGGHIFGAGPGCTYLIYGVAPPGGATLTSLLNINGMGYGKIEGLSFIMTGPGTSVSDKNSCCLNWDWDGTGDVGNSAMIFSHLSFANASYGMLIGAVLGFQSDNSVFINCIASNVRIGFKTGNFNAVNHTIIGGGGSSCFDFCYYASPGSFSGVFNASTAQNGIDFVFNTGQPSVIAGVRSESANFYNGAANVTLLDCLHQPNPNSPGYFIHSSGASGGWVVAENCWSEQGNIDGPRGMVRLNNCKFWRQDFNGLTGNWYLEMRDCFIGDSLGSICRFIRRQSLDYTGKVRTYDVEASSLSDGLFLLESYAGQGVNVGANTIPVNITIASPAVLSLPDAPIVHNLVAGQQIAFISNSDTLPTGVATGTTYYILAAGLTASQFEISTTPGGSAINTSGSQSGTHLLGLVRSYTVGDRVLKSNVASGGNPGWYCTTAGTAVSSTPGTAVFKAEANVA